MEDTLVPIAMFAMVGWAVYQAHVTRREQIRSQAEMQRQLLERLGSTRELAEFLRTPEGERFFEMFERVGFNTQNQMMRWIRPGVILLVLGVALAVIGIIEHPGGDTAGSPAERVLGSVSMSGGGVLAALGLALLIAAFVSYRIAERLESHRRANRSEAP
jgi:hypothetical protein